MRCRECGLEVDKDKAFCPVCGAPLKVTADYEYIQAEIANKVDRYFNEENEEKENVSNDNIDLFDDIKIEQTDDKVKKPASSRRESRRKQEKNNDQDDLAKTRNVYGSDSVFDNGDLISDSEYHDYDDRRSERADRYMTRSESGSERQRVRPRVIVRRKKQTAAKIITVLVIFVIVAAAAIGVLALLGTFNRTDNPAGNTASQQNASLTCNLSGGEVYSDPVEVSISNSVEGNIFYTLDGTEPSIDSKMYTGPFEISSSDIKRTYPEVTLRAVSFSSTSEKSGDLNITFSLEYDESVAKAIKKEEQETTTQEEKKELSVPLVSPGSGNYYEDTEITVSSPDGADIYYTYDGSMPDESSSRYMGPVKMIPGSNTFSAVCILDGERSEVTTYLYTLEYGYNVSADQAYNNVVNRLVNYGKVADYNLNTYDGGHAELSHNGITYIGNYTYYVIEVDYFTSDGILNYTEYYGVGVNYGGVDPLGRDGNSYYYV